ncbi:MAG: alpha/beta fold hydrolase [Deltaproteobacteria bacterium]|nr:MAG: alpha/beta fold hydrolase [Deltaproteobacteria bacterium]
MKAFLVDCFAAVMRTERSALSDDRSLVELGMDSLIAAEVTTYLQRELDLTLYPRELYDHPSIAALSSYVASELDRMHPAPSAPTAGRSSEPATPAAPAVAPDAPVRPAARPAVERLPGIAFILSSPRAGSTLLRVMLAGHPALFCPPELHLLRFDTLRERQRALGTSYLGEGLIRTVMELAQLDAAGAQGRVAAWLDEDAAIQAVYAWLQALAGARLLVDKSPSYASRLDTLERAEQLFDGARYVFLHRHPYAVIESFVRKRMNRLVGADADPHVFAEQVWATSNDNILAFLERIPPDRAHRIRYEELAREPERVMRATCDFLRVAYDPAVLSPYSGNRMTDGVHHQSVAIGDPDFLHHTGVDSHLAEVWRDIRLPRALGEPARRTAAALGYELPVEASAARAHTVEARAASQRHGPRESFVDVRGLRLCVLTWGSDDAPPVVCLHGILDHAAAMDEIAQRLVRRGVRVIAPDLRGHGRSGHVGAGGSYHLVDFVADVDALARTLGPAPFPLVGHSLGAVIAGLFAAARPGRISSLVLVEIALPADERPVAAGRLTTHLDHLASPHGHPVFPDLAAAAERLHTIMAMPPDQAAVAARRLTEPCDGGLRWRWDPRLTTRAGLSLGDVGSSADQLRELLGRVRCPVTWIHGDRSDLRRTARPVPDDGAREVVIRGGHNLHLESPDELAEVIASALPA